MSTLGAQNSTAYSEEFKLERSDNYLKQTSDNFRSQSSGSKS